MKRIIKKFFEKLTRVPKKSWPIIFSAAFFGVFLPLRFANASFVGWFVDKTLGVVMGVPMMFFSLALKLVMAIAVFFSTACAALLKWAITVDIPLTHCPAGMTNACIVDLGWTFTRDLANMSFILILVFIAFAYILQLESYGLKKALPKLIIVALIINFSKVFVGVIVDISQIIMNTFTDQLSAGNIFSQLGGFGGNILSSFTNIIDFTKQLNSVIQAIAMIVFNFVMGVMLLLYAIVFILRIIAIWFITILAPLAFASLILPITSKLWNKWLGWLFSWTFVGVYALFFLWLGFFLLGTINDYGLKNIELSSNNFGMTGLLQSMLPYAVVLLFLYFGFQLAISSAPAAAKKVMEGGMAATKVFGGKVGGFAKTAGWGMAIEPIKTYKDVKARYDKERKTNPSRSKSFGYAVRDQWQQFTWPTIKPTKKKIGTAATGVRDAIYDTAAAGTRKTFGLKGKGLRKQPCKTCGRTGIGKEAVNCPQCGNPL